MTKKERIILKKLRFDANYRKNFWDGHALNDKEAHNNMVISHRERMSVVSDCLNRICDILKIPRI